MSEDQQLLSRIADLSGHINLRRVQAPTHHITDTRIPYTLPQSTPISTQPLSFRTSSHYSPSHNRRGRVGKKTSYTHRNRSLVLKNIATTIDGYGECDAEPAKILNKQSLETPDLADTDPQAITTWVSKRDRHMQLINASVYDKETALRSEAIEKSRHERALLKDQREMLKISEHLRMIAHSTTLSTPAVSAKKTAVNNQLNINGLTFRVCHGGSKLIREQSEPGLTDPTPKRTVVGGVTFIRSKNGNLYRAGLVKSKRNLGVTKKILEPCKRFTSTGRCLRGPLCPYIHDADKVAICPSYLQGGDCPAGRSCDLSHDPTPERVPACLHFLRGRCLKPSCRYAHVRASPSAPVCRNFAILGYCSKGGQCKHRHVVECPDYANTSACRRQNCRLPHVDRAGQIREHKANPSVDGTKFAEYRAAEDEGNDLSSEEGDHDEIYSDDVDSDGLAEDATLQAEDLVSSNISQQLDFVGF